MLFNSMPYAQLLVQTGHSIHKCTGTKNILARKHGRIDWPSYKARMSCKCWSVIVRFRGVDNLQNMQNLAECFKMPAPKQSTNFVEPGNWETDKGEINLPVNQNCTNICRIYHLLHSSVWVVHKRQQWKFREAFCNAVQRLVILDPKILQYGQVRQVLAVYF